MAQESARWHLDSKIKIFNVLVELTFKESGKTNTETKIPLEEEWLKNARRFS